MDNRLNVRRRFSKEEREKVLLKTACKCGRCGKKLNTQSATIDHIIPLNKGGLNDEFNLIALCEQCNENKSNFVYDISDYYRYILPEYEKEYYDYHGFAAYDLHNGSLFNYDSCKYMVYPDKQKQLILGMLNRGTNKKKVVSIAKKMGVPVYLTRAYDGDAKEIMELIEQIISNKNTTVNKSIYKNDYMVANDINYGEVYVLRTHNSDKICGVFMFKRISDDTIQLPQLQSIIMNTSLHAKYVMTAAFVTNFARDCFNEIMNDITGRMMRRRAIPIYFDILSDMFFDINECIVIPWKFDGVNGNLEFMPLKYMRKTMRLTAEAAAKETDENLTEYELDLFVELLINHRNLSEFENADGEVKEFFKKT